MHKQSYLFDTPACVCGMRSWVLSCTHTTIPKAAHIPIGMTSAVYACGDCFRPAHYLKMGEEHAFIQPRAEVTSMSDAAIRFIANPLYTCMLKNYQTIVRMREEFEREQCQRIARLKLKYEHISDWTKLPQKAQRVYLALVASVYLDERWWWPNGYRATYPPVPPYLRVHLRTELNFVSSMPHSAWFAC